MQIEEDSYTGEVQFAKCELCGMIFNFLPANHKCIQPKSIAEVEKLFEEKFGFIDIKTAEPTGMSYEYRSIECVKQIKQFWLEHYRGLLEGLKMSEIDDDNPQWQNGYNQAVNDVNTAIQTLLGEGEKEETSTEDMNYELLEENVF